MKGRFLLASWLKSPPALPNPSVLIGRLIRHKNGWFGNPEEQGTVPTHLVWFVTEWIRITCSSSPPYLITTTLLGYLTWNGVGAMDGGFPARRDGNVTDIYDGLQVSVNIYKMVECTALWQTFI